MQPCSQKKDWPDEGQSGEIRGVSLRYGSNRAAVLRLLRVILAAFPAQDEQEDTDAKHQDVRREAENDAGGGDCISYIKIRAYYLYV